MHLRTNASMVHSKGVYSGGLGDSDENERSQSAPHGLARKPLAAKAHFQHPAVIGTTLAAGAAAWWLYGPILAAAAAVIVLFALGDLPLSMWLDARLERRHGPERLAGADASVSHRFVPEEQGAMLHGKVRVQGELWNARSHHPGLAQVEEGQAVKVVSVKRLTLNVAPRGRPE